MSRKVLLIEPNANFAGLLSQHIKSAWPNAEVAHVESLADAKERYAELKNAFFLAFAEYDALGLETFVSNPIDRRNKPSLAKELPRFIVLADESDERRAVNSIKAGALEYFSKRKLTNTQLRGALELADAGGTVSQGTNDESVEEKPLAAPAPRRRVSDLGPGVEGYKVIRALGSGAMATTYLADSEELGHEVVLKVIWNHDDSPHTREQLRRFEREYELISKSNSLEIVDIFDYGQKTAFSYIAMEYFPCGDLRTRLRNPVSTEDAVSYANQILRALEVIHPLGVFHRDIKPANIMLRDDNTLALIDFGAAKSDSSSGEITGPGEIFGTPYYMSPEQVLGVEVDGRADLYASAATFYEMLVGQPPFMARDVPKILHLHVSGSIPALPSHLTHFQSVIDRGLAKKREDRYATATEFLEDLQRAASGADRTVKLAVAGGTS